MLTRLFRPFYRFFMIDLFMDQEARPVLFYSIFLIVMGAFLFHWIEGWDYLDATYYTVVTITTIGFGDFAPVTRLGKFVTIFYALNGIAILLMLFDQIRRIRTQAYEAGDAPVIRKIQKRLE